MPDAMVKNLHFMIQHDRIPILKSSDGLGSGIGGQIFSLSGCLQDDQSFTGNWLTYDKILQESIGCPPIGIYLCPWQFSVSFGYTLILCFAFLVLGVFYVRLASLKLFLDTLHQGS